MLEYLFFHQLVADKFRTLLTELELEFEQTLEPIQQAILIRIGEPAPEIWDELDVLYDDLAEEDQALMEAEEGDTESRAGIYLQLAGGQQTVAKISPDILNRILSVLSMDELNQFLETIVSAVETPDDSPICKAGSPG